MDIFEMRDTAELVNCDDDGDLDQCDVKNVELPVRNTTPVTMSQETEVQLNNHWKWILRILIGLGILFVLNLSCLITLTWLSVYSGSKVSEINQRAQQNSLRLSSATFTQNTTTNPETTAPVNGSWGHWASWSSCSTTCGIGLRHKQRACNQPKPAFGGEVCEGDNSIYEICENQACRVVGSWGQWAHWSSCSKTCGVGMRQRSRPCNSSDSTVSGVTCVGHHLQYETCELKQCVDNGMGHWSPWSDWSECSTTCGKGLQQQTRNCTNDNPSAGVTFCTGDSTQYVICEVNTCTDTRFGLWTSWGDWSICSETCGKGIHRRQRNCSTSDPSTGEGLCPGDSTQYETCEDKICADDRFGLWISWSDWSTCSVTCGKGIHQRERICNTTDSALHTFCTGSSVQYGMCESKMCAVDGVWGDWGNWDQCSKTCGAGLRHRRRQCNNPEPAMSGTFCDGDHVQIELCESTTCNGQLATDGIWSPWSDWGTCSKSCGTGLRQRERLCKTSDDLPGLTACDGELLQYQICMNSSCAENGGWSPWGEWSTCSATCGSGLSHRQRSCNSPTPSLGGNYCDGDSNQFQTCEVISCAVDGSWSSWNPWDTCSAACGYGMRQRQRSCNNPAPQYSGMFCDGEPVQYTWCKNESCTEIAGWTAWSNWSSCSVSCGEGLRIRQRTCNNTKMSSDVHQCDGESHQYEMCNYETCEVQVNAGNGTGHKTLHGNWTNWSDWSTCSQSCGTGLRRRIRNCTNPALTDGIAFCSGETMQYDVCHNSSCGEVGNFTSWGEWSFCNATCGKGLRHRRRACNNPTLAFCNGEYLQYDMCENITCPVEVRLVGGTTQKGTVQVRHEGEWGTICDDDWDNFDAQVVCRMLQYSSGTALGSAYFGAGSGVIWLDDVGCTGSETSIADCPHLGWGEHNCAHHEDAGVNCG